MAAQSSEGEEEEQRWGRDGHGGGAVQFSEGRRVLEGGLWQDGGCIFLCAPKGGGQKPLLT